MQIRSLTALLLVAGLAAAAQADTTIVDDNFDSYADDNALYSVRVPPPGNGDGIREASLEFADVPTACVNVMQGAAGNDSRKGFARFPIS